MTTLKAQVQAAKAKRNDRRRELYHYARSLGFTAEEARALSNKSRKAIEAEWDGMVWNGANWVKVDAASVR